MVSFDDGKFALNVLRVWPSRILILILILMMVVASCQKISGSSPSRPPMVLKESGSIKASQDGQLIEGLHIVVSDGPAIEIEQFKNVTIRHCLIEHASGQGIKFSKADGLRLEWIDIRHSGFMGAAKLPDITHGNIDGMDSSGVVMDHIRATGGSAGIYLYNSPGASLSNLDLRNFRGPYWKGQAIQFNQSSDCVVDGFYIQNDPGKSWVEDNISVYHTSRCTIKNGLIKGNDAPYGAAIQFEQRQGTDADGLVDNVRALGTMNAGFSTYPGFNVTFRRTALKDNFCKDQGRGAPASGGLGWQAGGIANGAPSNSQNVQIENSVYFNLCNNNLTFGSWGLIDLKQEDFTEESPISIAFPWE